MIYKKYKIKEMLEEIRWYREVSSNNNMANYYLDIETTGLNPGVDKIITIQFQKLAWTTGEPIGELKILKSWESSEKKILEEFQEIFGNEHWNFVAHGYNLKFENDFLFHRSIACKLKNPIQLFDRPTIDLHPVVILMNNSEFKGSGLDMITGKNGNGLRCLSLYNAKQYNKVIKYIKQEAKEYLKFYVWLRKRMPDLVVEYHADCI